MLTGLENLRKLKLKVAMEKTENQPYLLSRILKQYRNWKTRHLWARE
jgi:hypothetical protein